VDGLALDAGGLGYFLEVFAGHVFEAYVFEGDGEADLKAEVDDLGEDLGGALLQHDHGYNPEGHLLAVPVVVRAFERREPVVDGVGGTSPPDSKPSPESRVFASTTFSTAGVTACRSTARRAARPCSRRVS
jgi:hypothetical protein